MTDVDRSDHFRALFDAHFKDVLGYALRRVGDIDAASDVAAEVFIVAWRKLDSMPTGSEARPWLFGVARNVVLNERRGIRRRNNLAKKIAAAIDQQLKDVEASTDQSEIEQVVKAMEHLNEEERELLRLVAWEELTPSEAAAVLGIPAVTARTKLHKARIKLRTTLAAQGGERSEDFGHVSLGEASSPSDTGEEMR